jgi:hypothetical protein
LSAVTMKTSQPARSPCTARVPITSSASYPETSNSGTPWARITARIASSCAIISAGAFSRVAL